MNENTKNWAAFGGEWIKAVEVLNNTDEYVIVSVDSKTEEGKGEVLHLIIERNGKEQKFGCNKTNMYAVQQQCPQSPEDVIGRVITFNKVKVAKPGTEPAEIVDGLRLVFKPIKVEEPSQVDTNNAGVEDDKTI